MIRRFPFDAITLLALALLWASCLSAAAAETPNIIVIMADDKY